MVKPWATRIRPVRASVAVLTVLALSACRWVTTGSPTALRPAPANAVQVVDACASACADSLDLVAMGVAGYLLVPWQDTTRLVLTPPMFTNPTVPWLVLGDLLLGTRPDTAQITRRLAAMPAAGTERLGRVRAVLVGHGHYDHLLDLPPLLPHMPHARVYGSETVRNLLAPVTSLADSMRVAVDTLAARHGAQAGQSIAVSPLIQLRAITWAHAPNIGSLTIAPGHQRTPRRTLPRTVHGWKMGTPYAWVVDVRQRPDPSAAVAVRLVYHDAAADADVQRRAAEVMATMPPAHVTVVIMTAANFDQANAYPDVLLAHLTPQHVLVGHWEDFFRSSSRPERVVRGTNAEALVRRLTPFVDTRWSAPRAGAVTRVRW